MSGLLDQIFQTFAPPQLVPPMTREPAGKVTPVLRSNLDNITDPDFLGRLVSSPDITEQEIDETVRHALLAQAMQDDIIEEGGRLIGLRVVESRPVSPPQADPRG